MFSEKRMDVTEKTNIRQFCISVDTSSSLYEHSRIQAIASLAINLRRSIPEF